MKERNQNNRAGVLSARFFVACVAAVLLTACAPREPGIAFKDGLVVAEGWSGPKPQAGWESVLEVRAGDDPSAPPMLGDYKESGGVITFTPRFAPSPGVPLHAMFHVNQKTLEASLAGIEKKIHATTSVTHIYPTTDEWPANTLKMYVEFSAPMAVGEAYRHVRILDEKGAVIEGPFVEVDQELWDPAGKRVTLLFDPGRLKRGLVDNETSGPPLTPGRIVTIEIDPSWRDATGAPLVEKATRVIHVSDSLRQVVDIKNWQTRWWSCTDNCKLDVAHRPLLVSFDRPLDHALAQRAISMMKDGLRIEGKIELEKNETQLRFTPSAPWSPGRHVVHVDGVIEDLAGNRLGKLFDVDTMDKSQSVTAALFAELTFDVPAR